MKNISALIKGKLVKKEILGALLLACIFVLPILTLAKNESKIYVNADASGVQDGSKKHPYNSINKALQQADKNSEIHIAKGTYEENIVLSKGVEIHGSGTSKVFIKAQNKNNSVVKMKDDTKIVGVTIEKGEHGIEVSEGARAKIINCVVRKNKKNGVNIEKGERSSKEEVVIFGSEIYDNGHKGIYSEKRKLTIEKNYIHRNESDGIYLQDGVKAWIAKNLVKKNRASGIRLELDRAEIFTKNNTYSENDREGIEINSRGENGRVDINASKFRYNGRWGIAKVQRVNAPAKIWNGVTVQKNVVMFGNKSGNVSPIIKN